VRDFEHPAGGWDVKAMAEALSEALDLIAEQAVKIEALKVQIAEVALIPPAPIGTYVPRNRRIL